MTAVPESPMSTPSTASGAPTFFQKNRIWFLVIGIFLLSIGGVYFYQRFQYNRLLKVCHVALDLKAAQADSLMIQRNEEEATNLSRALIWGIRGEMERGNKGEIDMFLNKMVQETGLELVVVQDDKDSIYLSTDKNYENHKIAYIQKALNKQEVLKSTLEETIVVAPILGTETRLGSCLLIYKPLVEAQELLQLIHQDSLPGDKPESGK